MYEKITFLIILSLIFASCGPTEDEIQSQIDTAVNEAEDNASSNTTVAEIITTTTQNNNYNSKSNNYNSKSNNNNSKCTMY